MQLLKHCACYFGCKRTVYNCSPCWYWKKLHTSISRNKHFFIFIFLQRLVKTTKSREIWRGKTNVLPSFLLAQSSYHLCKNKYKCIFHPNNTKTEGTSSNHHLSFVSVLQDKKNSWNFFFPYATCFPKQ